MKLFSLVRIAAIIAVLACLSIGFHELGHFLTYALFGYRARMSLQRVTPVGDIPVWIDHWAKFAGPAVSLVAATTLLFVARGRHSFAWVTASFTNASIRLFPCSMDLLRAIKGGRPFSDEGEVALAFTNSPIGRSGLILFVMSLSLVLTAFSAREYHFKKNRFIKSLLI